MKLRIKEETKNRIVLDVEGEDATFCNILRKELWNDKNVAVATYHVKHPLIGIPTITVETTSGNPKDALVKAAQRIKKLSDDFASELKKKIK